MSHNVVNRAIKVLQSCHLLPPRRLAALRYYFKFRHWPNIDEPEDLNEKIMALMFRTDTSEWTRLADKYEVRKFVEDRELGFLLPKLYGVYDSVEDIDLDALPEKCVVKSTSGCGFVLIYDGDKRPDPDEARAKMRKWLKSSYGYTTAEPHYTRIRPRLIVEELIEKDDPTAQSLIDYKIWCINGEPQFVFTCSERDIESHSARYGCFSIPDWEECHHLLHEGCSPHAVLPRPDHLILLTEFARRLAKGFPVVRVDLYDCGGRVLFGEMTFSSNGGRMRYFTDQALLDMGAAIDLNDVEFFD